ncbi:MAG: recombinase family protein [Clostridiales bacterium]|nr:recombinase family protein [Clostridiales bacterium]
MDDGYSGGNFERPAWKQLLADIEVGKVGQVLAKDMSRIGRDYLQTVSIRRWSSSSMASALLQSATGLTAQTRPAASLLHSSIS